MNVSVCMATFNGQKYIKRQILSILTQLNSSDELVIFDDASNDKTISIINSFKDERIKLFINQKNLGPVSTFNKALSNAKNEIIFLSDQDDYWLSNKVLNIKNIFKNQSIDLIVHDAKVIKNNKVLFCSLFKMHNSSSGLFKNLISNRFTGCCMALRKKTLDDLMPVPIKKGIYHDAWLGILAILLRKKILFLNEKLLEWNRHGNNDSTLKRRSLKLIIPDRLNLILSLFVRIVLKKNGNS